MTYIDTAWQGYVIWKCYFKVESIRAFCQPPIAAQDNLILEQGSEAVPPVFSRLLSMGSADAGDVATVSVRRRSAWRLEDLDKAMKTDGDVSDANGLDDPEDDVAGDLFTGRVLLVGIVGLDDEFRDAPAFLRKRRGESGEDAATGRRRSEERGGAFGARGHARIFRDTCESGMRLGFTSSLLSMSLGTQTQTT